MTSETRRISTFEALVRMHRIEYPLWIHYVCYGLWGSCYAVSHPGQLWSVPVLLIALSNVIHFVSMNVLNVAVDTESDMRNPNKRGLAEAVIRIGVNRVIALAAAEKAASVLLAVIVSLWTGHASVTVVSLVIIALHVVYNVEPVHLKRRGFANPVCLGLSFGALPFLMSFLAINESPQVTDWLIVAAIGASVTARGLWWMLPDRQADAEGGQVTLAVRYGAMPMLIVSSLIALAVPVLVGFGLWPEYGGGVALIGMLIGCGFVAGQATVFRAIAAHRTPSYRFIRWWGMTPAMLANIGFTVLPLVAG